MAGMGFGSAIQGAGDIIQLAANYLDTQRLRGAEDAAMAAQNKYRGQATGAFYGGLQNWENPQAGLADAQAQRLGLYNSVMQQPIFGMQSAETQSQQARDAAANQLAAQQRAKYAAYGDWLVKQTLGNLTAQRQLGKIGSFASGAAQVAPFSMYDAQHAYDWLSTIGSSLQSLAGSGGIQVPKQASPQQLSSAGGTQYGLGDVAVPADYSGPTSTEGAPM